jgi:hypothetical protein
MTISDGRLAAERRWGTAPDVTVGAAPVPSASRERRLAWDWFDMPVSDDIALLLRKVEMPVRVFWP